MPVPYQIDPHLEQLFICGRAVQCFVNLQK